VTSGSRGWSKYYDEKGQLFVRVGDISNPNIEIDFSDVQRVNLPEEERGHRSLLKPHDLLISITADIGKVGIVPEGVEEAYINQHVALTRPSDPTTTKFIAYYLISPGGGARQFRKLQRGATKAGLTLSNIKEIPIALPPVQELHQIVAEVERLLSVADDASTTVEREQTRADRLRQSILKQAFSGQLVPQEDESNFSPEGTTS
jgi:type I restriction enzyme S subunit